MPGLRVALSTTIATAVLALGAAGCGDDDDPPSVQAPEGAQTAPASTQPAATAPTGTTPKGSEAFGRYTLAVNAVLRESAAFAVAVQACARGDEGAAGSCVDKAQDKLHDVEEQYGEASDGLRKGASKACGDALTKSSGAVKGLVDVLEKIGDVARKADEKSFNTEARKLGQALQGRSGDLVAGQATCGS